MPRYVDGFVIPLKEKDVPAYVRMARAGKRAWLEHGALEYFECVGDDLAVHEGCHLGFAEGTKLARGETVVFAFIVYRSKKHRDAVNAKVMADPSLKRFMSERMPFDPTLMMHGGFAVLVEGRAR